MSMSRDLINRIQVIETAHGSVFPKPGKKELDRFEETSGVKLPRSYRDFAQRFGAGELAGYYRIAVPLNVSSRYDLARFNQAAHGDKAAQPWEGQGPPHVIDRVVFFASTIGGEMYAWDPADSRNARAREYSIYLFPRISEIEQVAGSFRGFIQDVCLKQEPREDGSIPPLEFSPFFS
jgi:hypothetical protein